MKLKERLFVLGILVFILASTNKAYETDPDEISDEEVQDFIDFLKEKAKQSGVTCDNYRNAKLENIDLGVPKDQVESIIEKLCLSLKEPEDRTHVRKLVEQILSLSNYLSDDEN